MQDNKPLVVGLAGFGTVGGGLCRLLRENADLVRRRCGRDIRIKTILVRNANKIREVETPAGAALVEYAAKIYADPEIDVVCELMGGIKPAKDLIDKALEHGKDIVSANKALLAEDGLGLFRKARKLGRALRYEASVAGAIPIVEILRESMSGNRITSLIGILNGTSNYILWEMTAGGLDFATALQQAHDLGYAEADPSLDIDGIDTAHKLTILIRLAFGIDYPFSSLYVRGIRDVSALDIRFAGEFGYNIKLIGQVRDVGEEGAPRLEAGVFPALAPKPSLMANVRGAVNAVRVDGNASGPLFFNGAGAGALPTAGSVLSDLIAIARYDRACNTGYDDSGLKKADIVPRAEWNATYYARVMVDDAPGVLRDISGCMAAHGVSVAQMIQKTETGQHAVPLVFMTHETTDLAMENALKMAAKKGLLREPAMCMRVL